MNFNLEAMIKEQANPTLHPPPPSSDGMDYFSEQALLRAGYPGFSNIRRLSGYFPNPIHSSAAIQREIEKELIREEIIMDEIVRRRMFDEELRRELMLERHVALNRMGGFLSSSSMLSNHRSNSYVLPSETRSLEERLTLSFEKREEFPVAVRRFEGSECKQFQRSSEHRVSKVNLLPAGASEEKYKSIQFQPRSEPVVSTVNLLPVGHGEERIKLMQFQCGSESRISTVNHLPEGATEGKPKSMDKPQVNLFGLKRKADSPLLISADEPTSNTSSKKIALTNECNYCSLCQVGATSKENLNDHLKGKKHKASVLKLRQKEGKNYEIGLFPKTSVEKQEMKTECCVSEKVNNLDSVCVGEEAAVKMKNDVPLQRQRQKKMKVHKRGKKKHLRNLQLLEGKGRVIPPSVQ